MRSGTPLRTIPGLLITILLLATACGDSPMPALPHSSTAPAPATAPSELREVGVSPDRPPQDNDIRFEHFSLEQGLSQSSIMCILQDSRGFMWFGTEDGLNKYDGHSFTVIKNDPDSPNSLSSNFIQCLHEDEAGLLWIGTRGGGLNRFDRETGQFARYQHDPNDPQGLSSDDVQAIYEDRAGTLWIATGDGGLNRFDRETEQFTNYRNDPDDPYSLCHNSVLAILEDHEGVLWIGTSGGLDRFEPEIERFTHYQNDPNDPHSLSNDHVQAIYEDHMGTLWVGSFGGLNELDRTTGRFQHYHHETDNPHSLSEDEVWTIHEDREGVLWVGTHGGGLNRFNRETEQFTHYQNDPLDPHSLSNNEVWSIYEDQGGVLWIGTFGGLNKFNPLTAHFVHFRNNPDDSNSLSENRVWSIYEDQHGVLWIGTYGGGLNRFDRHSGNWRHYQNDPDDPHSLSSDVVRLVYQDGAGVLWIGTDDGLNRFDDEREQFVRFQRDPGDPCSLSHSKVWPILEDREGMLWVGTWGGLNGFDRSSGCFTHHLINADDPGSLANKVWVIHEDRSGVLWIGTAGGLARFDRESGQFTRYQHDPDDPNSLSNNLVFTIHEDQLGALWIGTWGGGLSRFDPAEGTFAHYREKDGLANDVVYGILEDEQGDLWLSTNRGLSRFNPEKGVFKNYDATYGLQSDEFNNGAYHRSMSGEMFFGGINGFNAFYPEQIIDNSHISPIVISTFKKFNQTVRTDLPPDEHILLSYKDNFISFEFAALDYTAPERNQYAYMMEGLDKDWVYIGTQRHADYRNLRPGEYVLRVKGSNNDGVWNEEGTSIRITVTPPFWETWWFRGMVALALLGGVLGGYRLRVRSLEARSRELESQVEARTAQLRREIDQRIQAEEALRQGEREKAVAEERQRLARELHDSVTQALYGITLYSQAAAGQLSLGYADRVAKQLRELQDTALEALAEMRLLIFELRPPALEKEGLVATLQARLQAVEGRVGLKTKFKVEGEGRLPPETEEGLYRIAQEALNNALKHAHARNITVYLRQAERAVTLEVSDDGVGFDPATARERGGLGLSAMEERAVELGGHLTVKSEPGEGTQVIVEVLV